ncbi:unnamed protein product [Prorocentrum cordatum]|uniref:Fe2OG dioxygenase domain-containing protein n=1 Tax=Prorocentrum cordatum TaxID=2364126 RepID=A0ABN9V0E1_9DINO|nr:unnamed protein product [Polarella glacialis]
MSVGPTVGMPVVNWARDIAVFMCKRFMGAGFCRHAEQETPHVRPSRSPAGGPPDNEKRMVKNIEGLERQLEAETSTRADAAGGCGSMRVERSNGNDGQDIIAIQTITLGSKAAQLSNPDIADISKELPDGLMKRRAELPVGAQVLRLMRERDMVGVAVANLESELEAFIKQHGGGEELSANVGRAVQAAQQEVAEARRAASSEASELPSEPSMEELRALLHKSGARVPVEDDQVGGEVYPAGASPVALKSARAAAPPDGASNWETESSNWDDEASAEVIAFQEHHRMQDRLWELQDQSESGEGTTGGAGMVTEPYIAVAVPKGLAFHVVKFGGTCAAHVCRGVPGGLHAFPGYCFTSEAMGSASQRLVAQLWRSVTAVATHCNDWIVAGGFNMEASTLGLECARALQDIILALGSTGPWHLMQHAILKASADASLQKARVTVLAGLETELLGRLALVGDRLRGTVAGQDAAFTIAGKADNLGARVRKESQAKGVEWARDAVLREARGARGALRVKALQEVLKARLGASPSASASDAMEVCKEIWRTYGLVAAASALGRGVGCVLAAYLWVADTATMDLKGSSMPLHRDEAAAGADCPGAGADQGRTAPAQEPPGGARARAEAQLGHGRHALAVAPEAQPRFGQRLHEPRQSPGPRPGAQAAADVAEGCSEGDVIAKFHQLPWRSGTLSNQQWASSLRMYKQARSPSPGRSGEFGGEPGSALAAVRAPRFRSPPPGPSAFGDAPPELPGRKRPLAHAEAKVPSHIVRSPSPPRRGQKRPPGHDDLPLHASASSEQPQPQPWCPSADGPPAHGRRAAAEPHPHRHPPRQASPQPAPTQHEAEAPQPEASREAEQWRLEFERLRQASHDSAEPECASQQQWETSERQGVVRCPEDLTDATVRVLSPALSAAEAEGLLEAARAAAFDRGPDSVDGKPTFQANILSKGLPVDAALAAKLRPILDQRLLPYARNAANCSGCVACTAIVRRYLAGERLRHPRHHDREAFMTMVVALSPASAYTGGLYVQPGYSAEGREFVALEAGEAVMHDFTLRHGVEVLSGERFSLAVWLKPSAESCSSGSSPWYLETAAAGDPHAQFVHGDLLWRRAPTEGVPWLRSAAEQGHAVAMHHLAIACEAGRGTPQDPAEAVLWYARSAERGYAPAMAAVAVAHGVGVGGLPQNATAYLAWTRRAAEHGEEVAMKRLADSLLEGEGGSGADVAGAVEWYRRSAQLGHEPAAAALKALVRRRARPRSASSEAARQSLAGRSRKGRFAEVHQDPAWRLEYAGTCDDGGRGVPADEISNCLGDCPSAAHLHEVRAQFSSSLPSWPALPPPLTRAPVEDRVAGRRVQPLGEALRGPRPEAEPPGSPARAQGPLAEFTSVDEMLADVKRNRELRRRQAASAPDAAAGGPLTGASAETLGGETSGGACGSGATPWPLSQQLPAPSNIRRMLAEAKVNRASRRRTPATRRSPRGTQGRLQRRPPGEPKPGEGPARRGGVRRGRRGAAPPAEEAGAGSAEDAARRLPWRPRARRRRLPAVARPAAPGRGPRRRPRRRGGRAQRCGGRLAAPRGRRPGEAQGPRERGAGRRLHRPAPAEVWRHGGRPAAAGRGGGGRRSQGARAEGQGPRQRHAALQARRFPPQRGRGRQRARRGAAAEIPAGAGHGVPLRSPRPARPRAGRRPRGLPLGRRARRGASQCWVPRAVQRAAQRLGRRRVAGRRVARGRVWRWRAGRRRGRWWRRHGRRWRRLQRRRRQRLVGLGGWWRHRRWRWRWRWRQHRRWRWRRWRRRGWRRRHSRRQRRRRRDWWRSGRRRRRRCGRRRWGWRCRRRRRWRRRRWRRRCHRRWRQRRGRRREWWRQRERRRRKRGRRRQGRQHCRRWRWRRGRGRGWWRCQRRRQRRRRRWRGWWRLERRRDGRGGRPRGSGWWRHWRRRRWRRGRGRG